MQWRGSRLRGRSGRANRSPIRSNCPGLSVQVTRGALVCWRNQRMYNWEIMTTWQVWGPLATAIVLILIGILVNQAGLHRLDDKQGVRMDKLEAKMDANSDRLNAKMDANSDRLNAKMDALLVSMTGLIINHEHRVTKLESNAPRRPGEE